MEDFKECSCSLLFMRMGNFIMLIMGFAMIGGSLYLFSIPGKGTDINFALFFIGIAETFLSCVSFKIARSICGVTLYILVLVVLLLSKLISFLIILVSFDKLVEFALPNETSLQEKAKSLIINNMNYICYILLGAILVQISNILFAFWHRSSLKHLSKRKNAKSAKPYISELTLKIPLGYQG
jgi:hypothetical protein